ncbi:MAG: hypothetical protein GF383_16060, partial [Candidatus Lokiarchaeota archaeon]|nr:hypothetical protein [Candidatus Lokiarchaeota archaeon]MBD3343240.1 hypothetical protein [Candidatus Lokiarchaeota archaeon]
LGTSDTYFSYMKDLYVDFNGEGHVFGAPTGDYMSLICFKNGSLAREKIKDAFNLDWSQFSKILKKSPPGNYGKIIIPYFLPEIVPLVLEPKVYRFGMDDTDLEGNVRGIIEARFLSMKLHSEWIKETTKEIYATGGASVNKEILQVAANIFNAKVHKFEVTDSAAFGAALRSAKSYFDYKNDKEDKNWEFITQKFLQSQEEDIIYPQENTKKLYEDMLRLYEKYEDFILRGGKDPESIRLKFIKKYFSHVDNKY